MTTAGKLATALGLVGGYALWVRPRMLRWGATDDEVERPYPGADLVPGGKRTATMAATIEAPPAQVWPWLVQMGANRAGWYSWDWLDNNGQPSANRVVPEWQDLEVGRHLKGPTNWWTVVVVDPNRTLVLQSAYRLPSGQSFDPQSSPLPRVYADGTGASIFSLTPAGEPVWWPVPGTGAARGR
jgi:hypothetical protein